jgi:hypothetical protein
MRALAIRAAAVAAMLDPCALMAQEAAPNIAVTHSAPVHYGRTSMRSPVAAFSADHIPAAPSPIIMLNGDVAMLGTIRSQSGGREWDGGAFHLAAMRGRSESARMAGQSFEYQRFAMMAIGADLSRDISDRDTLTLAGTYVAQRWHPAFIVGPHRYYRTDERAVALHWTRDDRLDLAGTLFDTGPANRRTAVERITDLAGGAPREVRGWGLTASLYPAGEPGRLSVGIDFRDQQDRDIQRQDARVQIFLRQKF